MSPHQKPLVDVDMSALTDMLANMMLENSSQLTGMMNHGVDVAKLADTVAGIMKNNGEQLISNLNGKGNKKQLSDIIKTSLEEASNGPFSGYSELSGAANDQQEGDFSDLNAMRKQILG